MKKITLLFFAVLAFTSKISGQANLLVEAPLNNGSTTQVRAPNGLSTSAYMRACALVLQSELSNIPAGTSITSFGFTLTAGASVNAVAGNFTVYLQNTNDVTYQKGTNFPTAITGMTSVYSSIMIIPVSAGTTSIMLNLSTPFTYTGGGIYVAYDWFSSGPYSSTPATYLSESAALNPGTASGASATSPAPTALTTTAFRPAFLFGAVNSYTNEIQVIGVETPSGKVAAMFNSPQTIKAIVKNGSNITQTNVPVSLAIGGANPFTNTQTIASIAAGANATVNFAAYNPVIPGANTISVTVPNDQNNLNNLATYAQSVTCNTWALNPSSGSYTTGVGYGAGSGIIANTYLNPVASTLTALRAAISMDAATPGNSGYGVLMNAAGVILATTNTVSLTNAMLGTLRTFTFAIPQNLTANTTYYLGFAQTTGAAAYYPMGALASPYIAANAYVTAALAGGLLTPLTQNLGYFGIEAVFGHTVTISTSSQSVICGNAATLTALSSTNYSWSTGATSSSIIVSPTVPTSYSVVASNTMGCSASTVALVSVNPITVTATSNTNTICQGNTVSLSVSGANTYSWAMGATTASVVESPATSTVFVVTGTNSAGCSAGGFVFITVNPLPSVTILSSTPAICIGSSVSYTAGGANFFSWDNGATTSVVNFTPTISTTYTVTGTDLNGCFSTQTASIAVYSFSLTVSSNTSICSGISLTLSASGAFTYNWLIGTGYPFPNTVISPTISTTYTVIGTDLNACTVTKTISVGVNPNPTITAVASRTNMCKGESINITASGASTYSWTNISSSTVVSPTVVFTPSVSSTQTYSIVGSDNNNCVSTGTISIKVNACTGLNEKQQSNSYIHIFPNPTNGIFTIRFDNMPQATVIEIYSSLGTLIKRMDLASENTSIDLQTEANGVYFVNTLENNKLIHVSKIVKQ